jgi:hypothetical protein
MKNFPKSDYALVRGNIDKTFVEQDNGDAMFYFSNLGGGSSNTLNMEVKKKKIEQITELKKKT